ncbi:MAG TPA: YciI family protein [Gaiellaceae bacterium]
MQYMLLIYDDEQVWENMSEEERGQVFAQYGAYTQELREAGAFLYGDALQPTASATTVTVRDGETLATDGPFAETKEQLGGLYVIEAESIDQALEWASKIPSARIGKIEVRPVVIYDTAEAPAG